MLRQIISAYRKDRFLGSHRCLLYYAHVIACIHGIGFIIQGTAMLEGPIIYALTNRDAWHGGLPALSIFSMSLLAGISTTLLTLIALYLVESNVRSAWNWLLTVIIFLCGGGFVFVFISMIVHISLKIRIKDQSHKHTAIGETLLGVLLIWLCVSWLLGWIIPDVMQSISVALFITCDIVIPVTIVLSYQISHFQSKTS